MANPKTVGEALKGAPQGTQWYKPANGNTPPSFLMKWPNGKFRAKARGGDWVDIDIKQAETFYRTEGLTQSNQPGWYVKPTSAAPAKKKTPPATKGAPKQKEEKPKKEEEELPPQFDETDILVSEIAQGEFDQANFDGLVQDWRVRLALAPGSGYFYDGRNPGIMQPLQATNGVVFPYTPQIVVGYSANYNGIDIIHSNYKVQQYTNSSVDQVSITCDFTAQDVFEARYLLAVIHFFRSMTKMFYGQDTYPIRGTPPPLCYMFGMGGYQFAAHPLAISSFNYTLPNDVDYIKTVAPAPDVAPSTESAQLDKIMSADVVTQMKQDRLGNQCVVGGTPPPPKFTNIPKDITTWVPTKIQITIGCIPIMSRNQVANYFSLNDYASGKLIKGTSRLGGGMW